MSHTLTPYNSHFTSLQLLLRLMGCKIWLNNSSFCADLSQSRMANLGQAFDVTCRTEETANEIYVQEYVGENSVNNPLTGNHLANYFPSTGHFLCAFFPTFGPRWGVTNPMMMMSNPMMAMMMGGSGACGRMEWRSSQFAGLHTMDDIIKLSLHIHMYV